MTYKTVAYVFASLICLSTSIYASATTETKTNTSSIALLEQPNTNAKIVANVPVGQALISIFSQNGWVKVGDPKNGNVGWVNSKTLQTQDYPLVYMEINSNKNGNKATQSYQVIQYSGSQSMNQAQMQKMLNNTEQQQANIQNEMNKVMQQNIKDMNALNHNYNQMRILVPTEQSTQQSTK